MTVTELIQASTTNQSVQFYRDDLWKEVEITGVRDASSRFDRGAVSFLLQGVERCIDLEDAEDLLRKKP